MRIGIILETNEPEKAWNGIPFANTALKKEHEAKLFLMSAGVEVEKHHQRKVQPE
jgi:sulfur relay (sulfurtransferase) complex TusBCD TusD component (DsrE family)